mgnify:CR=1 FL=1
MRIYGICLHPSVGEWVSAEALIEKRATMTFYTYLKIFIDWPKMWQKDTTVTSGIDSAKRITIRTLRLADWTVSECVCQWIMDILSAQTEFTLSRSFWLTFDLRKTKSFSVKYKKRNEITEQKQQKTNYRAQWMSSAHFLARSGGQH